MLATKFTNEQYNTILEVMEREFDTELYYQEQSTEPDTTLLDKYVDALCALQQMPVRTLIEKVVADDICETYRKKVNDLKERR